MDAGRRERAHTAFAWLPVAVPAYASRFQVEHPGLAASLTSAGAELVDERPDVEIAVDRLPQGDAEHAIACFVTSLRDASRWTRAALRAAASARLELRARAARRRLRGHGFAHVELLRWEENRRLGTGLRHGVDWKGRLPLGRIVVARRADPRPTQLDAAVAEAGLELDQPPEIRQGIVLARGPEHVLRLAAGAPAHQVLAQRDALRRLLATRLRGPVRRLVPWPLRDGRSGLTHWSLERRLFGTVPPVGMPAIVPQAVEFLVALHGCRGRDDTRASLLDPAAVVAAHLSGDDGDRLLALAEEAEARTADLPRGFAHGDFCRENLLFTGDELTGVVDWENSGPGRLPGCDLLHLLATMAYERRRLPLGTAVVQHVLPLARAGGDVAIRSYCERVGIPPEPTVLEALVAAAWLQYVAYQLQAYTDRARRPRWMAANVRGVLDALTPSLCPRWQPEPAPTGRVSVG